MPVWLVLGVQSIAKRTPSIFPGVPARGKALAVVAVGCAFVGGRAEQTHSVGVAWDTTAATVGGTAVSVGGAVVGVGDASPQPDSARPKHRTHKTNANFSFISFFLLQQ